jgi:hypothetical protein
MAPVLNPGLGRSAAGVGKVRLSDPCLSHAIGDHLKICLGFRLKGPAHSAPCRLGVTSSGFDNVRLGQVSLTQQTYRRIFPRGRSVP